MRTVHLLRKYNPADWGGTETAVQRLFDGLREQGVTAVVYCPRLESPPGNGQDPLAASGYCIRRFRAFVPVWGISNQRKRQMISSGGNLMSLELVRSLWGEDDFALIHTHTLGRIGGIARTIARRRRVPLVITIHGGVLDLPPELKKSFNSRAAGWEWGRLFGLIFQSHHLFRDADAIITCNRNEAALLRQQHPAKRIVVQPHGVPLSAYQTDRRTHALSAYPQIAGRQVLLCVGRIDGVKNQGWLLDQAAEVFGRHPRALFVLAGAATDEVYGEGIRRRIERKGWQDRVLLTGGLPPNDPRLIGLLQQAEVLLLPSISETFGLVILEAWAAGTLVVSSRTSGAQALVRHGQNGWLFDLNDPATFHEALDQALALPEPARRLARSGMDEVSREYDVVAVAGRMKRLYEELIEEKHAIRPVA